jgi:hypothetical protein
MGGFMLLDVVDFEILSDYKVKLVFENNEQKIFDVSKIFHQKPFEVLQDYHYFKQARIEYGTLSWPNDIDIAPETLYLDSVAA